MNRECIYTRVLSGVLLWALFSSLNARPTELFISEYIEGSSNNKALEIFNGTAADISLDGYTVSTSFNGGTVIKNLSLSGTISAGDVFVLAHKKASSLILSEADYLVPVTWFNGDDAIILLKHSVVIDVFGTVGVDPGTQWGSGDHGTKDHSLRRQSDVFSGDVNGDDEFLPSDEWDGFKKDDFSGLGSHVITGINNPPVISGVPAISVNQGQVYSFSPNGSDSDGDSLQFSIENKPDWADFNSESGQLSGTPVNDDVGVFTGIKITVTDGQGGMDFLESFTLTVVNINDAPLIGGVPATSVHQGEKYSFIPTSSDLDGDELLFASNNLPAWLELNSVTGAVSGTPGNSDVGVYDEIEITVSDGHGGIDSIDPFTLHVINVNDAPTLFGIADNSVKQNNRYQFLPVSADIDGDVLRFSILNKPSWAHFNLDTGELSGVPGNINTGHYKNILITASDDFGGVVSLPPFVISVLNVNDSPVNLGNTPAEEVLAGNFYGYTPKVIDPDGDQLNFTIQNVPLWASFDSATGTLNGIPGQSDRGIYAGISITASDPGGVSVTIGPFRILVFDQNRAPEFEIGTNQFVYKNSGRHMVTGWAKNISDGDFETQQLRFEIIENTNPGLFHGLFVAKPDISPTTGTLFFRPALHAEGSATLTVVLKDDGGTAAGGDDQSQAQQFTITVDAAQNLGAGELFDPGIFELNEDEDAVDDEESSLTNLSLALDLSALDTMSSVFNGLGDFNYTPPLNELNAVDQIAFESTTIETAGTDQTRATVMVNAHIINHGEDAAEQVQLHLLFHEESEVIEYDHRCLPGNREAQISCQLNEEIGDSVTLQFAVSVKETNGILAEAEILTAHDRDFRDNSAILRFDEERTNDKPTAKAEDPSHGGGGLGVWMLFLMLIAHIRSAHTRPSKLNHRNSLDF